MYFFNQSCLSNTGITADKHYCRSLPACAFESTHQFFQFTFTAIKLLRKFEPAGIIGLS
ncbi:hypothetical protein THIOM_001257 [Candidatus Thiomargarita nelsonii]|uniref:Uncharacterized protein n=1 Tax=Candidatus Thiomargarita nelsonii TaxID=1003181 RepID=A0A176S4C6_9GAMM|nr:hypothetical protein THIOM_001257 [Candidatus Thiomargarita nelsonii]